MFSDFDVVNPATQGRYRVAIRGAEPGSSTCTCPDFASNQLGTCKHIEFTLGQLLKRRGTKAALQRGWQPAHSELWLHQGPQRSVRLRLGTGAPAALAALAAPQPWTGPAPRLLQGGELALFNGLVQGTWGQRLRLEQERLPWRLVLQALAAL